MESVAIDLLANYFEKIQSGYIINTGTNPTMHSHRFYTIDYRGSVQDSLLKNETKWEFYSKSLMEAFPQLQKQGFRTIRNYFENSRYSIFDIVLQKAGSDTRVFQFAYDKKRNELYEHSFIGSEDSDEIFKQLIGLTEKNELIYMLYPVEVIDKLETLKSYETGNISRLEGLSEMDNPIIAFCKIAR